MTPTEFLSLGDRRIEYRVIKPPQPGPRDLVMLHEGLGSVSMWKDFPEQLAEATGCRTLVYSRHGYGGSSPLVGDRDPDYMHEEAAVRLPALLEALEFQNAVLFGHSDGASIALIHAAMSSSTVAGVIALAPHVLVEDISVDGIRQARVAYESTDLRERLKRHHDDVDSVFWGWNRIWLSPAFRDWNIESLLSQIRCPVLAVQGRDDEYGTMEQVRRIARVLPGTRLVELERCGHSPHRDQPTAVLAETRDFVLRLGRPPRSHSSANHRPTPS